MVVLKVGGLKNIGFWGFTEVAGDETEQHEIGRMKLNFIFFDTQAGLNLRSDSLVSLISFVGFDPLYLFWGPIKLL